MKTKRQYLKAKFTTEQNNAKNLSGNRELTSYYKIIDKKSEKTVVDCRCYMSKGRTSKVVHCSLWVNLTGTLLTSTSGYGQAGGWGCHIESSAIQDAITSAGIKLFGNAYNLKYSDFNFKTEVSVAGCGTHESALLAIAYAAGHNNCIFVKG